MIADGLWVGRRHRLASPHQPPRRRDCLGELVQIDGSEHPWFEDRGETCTLLAFVDDAISRLMQCGSFFRAGLRLLPALTWRHANRWRLQRQAQHFPGERQGRGFGGRITQLAAR